MGKVIHGELCKKLKFDHTTKLYFHNLESVLENGFWGINISVNFNQKARRNYNYQKKKKKGKKSEPSLVDFTAPANDWVKIQESEKTDNYLDLTRELKKMRVTVMLIVTGIFIMVFKGLESGLEDLEIEGRIETIQTTALLRSARILRGVLETWWDLLSVTLQWKSTGQLWCEKFATSNLQEVE